MTNSNPKGFYLKPKPPRKKEPSSTFFYSSVIAAFAIMGILSYFSLHQGPMRPVSLASFSQLDFIYRTEGMARFLEEKEALKFRIQQSLKSKNQEEADRASNIAVFLFPDVLPRDHMEKDVGLEQWGPLQKQIEGAPKAQEARKSFEDMRANIWNYESPDRNFPELSSAAKQVIRIYDQLSSAQ